MLTEPSFTLVPFKLFFRTEPRLYTPKATPGTCSPEVKRKRPGSVWLLIYSDYLLFLKRGDVLHLSLLSCDQTATELLRTAEGVGAAGVE